MIWYKINQQMPSIQTYGISDVDMNIGQPTNNVPKYSIYEYIALVSECIGVHLWEHIYDG